MTEISFESEELGEPEIVTDFSMEGYEKYRLKVSGLTVDVAIVSLEDRDKEEYIEGRKEELVSDQVDVPHPYKPEKQEKKRDSGRRVVFGDEPLHGKGFADPEYNLALEDENEIIRYRYIVTWKEFPSENKLVEIETYVPKENDDEGILDEIRSVEI